MNKLPIIELFHSIQGEGEFSGVPSIFIRVTGCNLRCVFKNSICDTEYTSFNPGKPIFADMDELEDAIRSIKNQYPNTNHLVITGGEPMLYKQGIKELLARLRDLYFVVTMETNGTLGIIEELFDDFNYINLYSVSPKLSTSVDKNGFFLNKEKIEQHNKTRIQFDKLAQFFTHPHRSDVQLKFVYSGEESVKEIKEIIEILNCKEDFNCNIKPYHIMLMPEGTTTEQLKNNQEECANVCIREGWRFCDRLHIRIWEDKKGV
jgi:7-carboxy-7-deazaguanine synthase